LYPKPPNSQKGRKALIFPTFKPGKFGQASIHKCCIGRRFDCYTRWDKKEEILVNTPTLTWMYTRTFKERREEEIRNSTDIGVGSPIKRDDAVYLNKK
jgi:hypothetical protein